MTGLISSVFHVATARLHQSAMEVVRFWIDRSLATVVGGFRLQTAFWDSRMVGKTETCGIVDKQAMV